MSIKRLELYYGPMVGKSTKRMDLFTHASAKIQDSVSLYFFLGDELISSFHVIDLVTLPHFFIYFIFVTTIHSF